MFLLAILCGLQFVSNVFGVGPATNIRLVNGGTDTQGRLEVFADGAWGTVCSDYFWTQEAVVVCRMLDFTDLSQAENRNYAAFGQGTGPIHLDNLNCNGNEKSLFDCPHPGIGVHNCYHYRDAGVACAAPGKDGCLDEPDCPIPAASCMYGRTEVVKVPHRRCPICRCASCPEEPTCPTDCVSGKTEFFEGLYCTRCRCVPHEWPAVIEEPNTISVGLMVAVVMVALVLPLACLIVVVIMKRSQDKDIAKDKKKKDRDPTLQPPKQGNWVDN